MRELISKEIAIYNRVHGLMYESNVKMCTMTGMHSSISRLTESFIIGLQQDFPSTISTIFRTGDKLVRKSDEESSKCIFCESSIEILTPGKCSAMDALELSSKLGQTDKLSVNNFVKSEKNIKCDSCQCGADKHTESNVVKNQLCYACRLLVNEMDDLDLLPSSILKQANLQANRLKMKESIAEFLINDG
ncbi:CTU2 (predicted) [Pycnogonum litorale]